jgi:hypothetical protein
MPIQGTVGIDTGSNIIGKVINQIVFTDADAFGAATPLTPKNVAGGATVYADAQDISQQTVYDWFIQNTGGNPLTQNVTVVVQISPDNSTWIDDTETIITVTAGAAGEMITVTNFLQYARYVITGGLAATTVISCFQAKH